MSEPGETTAIRNTLADAWRKRRNTDEDEGRAKSRKMGRTWSTIEEQEVWAQKSKHTAGATLRQIRRQKQTPTHTHSLPSDSCTLAIYISPAHLAGACLPSPAAQGPAGLQTADRARSTRGALIHRCPSSQSTGAHGTVMNRVRGEEKRCVSRWRHGKHHERAILWACLAVMSCRKSQ